MRRLFELACLAYPSKYRDARASEVIDTAAEASADSPTRALREAWSLAVGGLLTRSRLAASHPRTTLASGAVLCARVLAVVNLAVALYGLTARVHLLSHPVQAVYFSPGYTPYAIDWWWIAFAAVSAGLVLALEQGRARLALWLAGMNLGLVGYDALVLANGDKYDGRGHFDLFTYAQTSSFPGGREWLATAAVLFAAGLLSYRAVGARNRRGMRCSAVAFAIAVALVVIARETWGAFFYLRWCVVAIVLAAILVGWLAPRVAVLAAGVSLAVLPSSVAYITAENLAPSGWLVGAFVLSLALGLLAPVVLLLSRPKEPN